MGKFRELTDLIRVLARVTSGTPIRQLWGKYCINEADGKTMIQGDYEKKADKPDLLLVLPARETSRIEYLDAEPVQEEQAMSNAYSMMAWHETLRGAHPLAKSVVSLHECE